MGAENPTHYKNHPSGIECIQVIYPLYYGQGNAIKYLWRAGQKDEDLQELMKAMWYMLHTIDADLEYFYNENPFASQTAFGLWFDHEPEGYRKEAITAIYCGMNYVAVEILVKWYASIAGIDVADVKLPEVPPVGMSPFDVKDTTGFVQSESKHWKLADDDISGAVSE